MTSSSRESSLPRPSPGLRRVLDDSALTFESGVLEHLVQRHPDNLDYLAALGQVYSRLRRHDHGLAVDRRLVEARPDEPTFRYNLSCSLCLTGDLDGACAELLAAVDRGYRDFEHLMADDDLVALRNDRRFGLVRDHVRDVTGERLPGSEPQNA